MNCNLLAHSLKQQFSEVGIPLHCNDKHYIQSIEKLPAILLLPPQLIEIERNKNGRKSYSIELYMLEYGAKLTPEEREIKIAEMESKILEALTSLGELPNIIAVERLKLRPSLFNLTTRGEISLSATAEIITCF